MMVRHFSQRFREHSWFGVAIDLLVVVAGILLALQFDGWVEDRKDHRLEQLYLQRLVDDLEIERGRMEEAEQYARNRIEAVHELARLVSDPETAVAEPSKVLWAVESASWRSFPQIQGFVYRELQSTGRLALIGSEPLRRSLAEHYTSLQMNARVGEERAAEDRYDAAVAGLLSLDELEVLERAGGDRGNWTTTPERAVAIAKGLAARPAALAELPGIAQHHTFNLRVIEQMRAEGDEIIQQIRALPGASDS